MNITILVDGLPVTTLEVLNLWRDLLIYAASRWEAEAHLAAGAALIELLAG